MKDNLILLGISPFVAGKLKSGEIPDLTLSALQSWLRNTKDVHVEVVSHKYTIKELSSHPRSFRYIFDGKYSNESYSNYDQALEEGLKLATKTLKIKY